MNSLRYEAGVQLQALQQRKKTYEEKRQLDALNSDYVMLQMRSKELRKNMQGQMQLNAA